MLNIARRFSVNMHVPICKCIIYYNSTSKLSRTCRIQTQGLKNTFCAYPPWLFKWGFLCGVMELTEPNQPDTIW